MLACIQILGETVTKSFSKMVMAIALAAIAAQTAIAIAAFNAGTIGATTTTAVAEIGAAASTTTAVAGTGAAVSASVTAGGAVAVTISTVGLITIGADRRGDELTFDCWKPVLHDTSAGRSSGMKLNDIVRDHRIHRVVVAEGKVGQHLPDISLVNVWGEKFDLHYMVLPDDGQLAYHAQRIPSLSY